MSKTAQRKKTQLSIGKKIGKLVKPHQDMTEFHKVVKANKLTGLLYIGALNEYLKNADMAY